MYTCYLITNYSLPKKILSILLFFITVLGVECAEARRCEQVAPEPHIKQDPIAQEYARNKELIKTLPPAESVMMLLRNQQIEKMWVEKAIQSYISQFELELIPVERKGMETIIEKREDPVTVLDRFIPDDFKYELAVIRYRIQLTPSSPKPITDFDIISVNNISPENIGDGVFYAYKESKGLNHIDVTLRDKKNSAIVFTLRHSYFIDGEKVVYTPTGWVYPIAILGVLVKMMVILSFLFFLAKRM